MLMRICEQPLFKNNSLKWNLKGKMTAKVLALKLIFLKTGNSLKNTNTLSLNFNKLKKIVQIHHNFHLSFVF